MDANLKAREGRSEQANPRRLDITVLMGGPSSEREVSLISGAAISDALERIGHRVTTPLGPFRLQHLPVHGATQLATVGLRLLETQHLSAQIDAMANPIQPWHHPVRTWLQ